MQHLHAQCTAPSTTTRTHVCGVCMHRRFTTGSSLATHQPSSRARTVRAYSLLGGLFGSKGSNDMGAAGSKDERKGWAPATGAFSQQDTRHLACMSSCRAAAECCGFGCCPLSFLPAAEGTPRKVSRSGFDVTPLTAEQKAKEAAQLTDFQK